MKLAEILIRLQEAEESVKRSAWNRGVVKTAIEMVGGQIEYLGSDFEVECDRKSFEKQFLNGAANWAEYSESGSALIYDEDIVERYSPASFINKWKGKDTAPSGETWLQVQARALWQAFDLIFRTAWDLYTISNATRYFNETHPTEALISHSGYDGWAVTPDGDKARLRRIQSHGKAMNMTIPLVDAWNLVPYKTRQDWCKNHAA